MPSGLTATPPGLPPRLIVFVTRTVRIDTGDRPVTGVRDPHRAGAGRDTFGLEPTVIVRSKSPTKLPNFESVPSK